MSDPISLTIILISLVKGFFSGVGSKTGQSFCERVKEKFESSIADKIGDAFLKASSNQANLAASVDNQINIFEEDKYYDQLIYGFDLIDGEDLSPYHKQISKLFLVEIFKDETLKNILFNKKLDNIKKDTIEIKTDMRDIKSKFISTLSEYFFDKFISDIDFDDFPHYYIHRQISVGTDWFSENRISSFNELLDYCRNSQQNKSLPIRVLIIADGGIGKSVYLKYLAKDCSESKKLYPVYISLRDLKPNDILKDYVERRYPDLKKIDSAKYDQLCLFLDGFDEIGDSSAAVKQIDDLCRTYTRSHIVLTSRRNSFFNQLPDFSEGFVFTLLDIDDKDIETYIQTVYIGHNIDTTHFFKEVNENNFSNLIYNPFYLDVLINCYINNNNSLKISKKILIDNLISKRREIDKTKRPDLELEKPTTKLKLLQLGKKFAFVQALMDQRNLSNENIARLFNNDFDLAISSLPIRKKSQIHGEQQWEFEHNIFLEHLVSDVLKDIELEQILEYTTSNNKVKSKWRDIMSHLLGILDKEDLSERELYKNLINWLIKNDFELLLELENSQLSQDMRSEIFIQIYQWYHKNTIWFDKNKIDIKQMALFGGAKENILLVFDDIINENKHYRQRINASLIFQHFNLGGFTQEEREDISRKYVESLISISDKENNDSLIAYLISNYPFENTFLIDHIIQRFKNSQSSRIISDITRLINKNNLQDKYIDLLIKWYESVGKKIESSDFSIKNSIVACFSNLNESESCIKLFNFLQRSNLYYRLNTYDESNPYSVIDSALRCYNKDVLNSVIDLSTQHASWHSLKDWKPFEHFFQNDNIRKDAINMILAKITFKENDKNSDWRYIGLIAKIIQEEDLPLLYDLIDSRKFYITLNNWTTKELVKTNLLKLLKDKYNYTPAIQIDPWPERIIDEFNILFEKEKFKNECIAIFDDLNVDSIIPSTLYEKEINGKYRNRTILSFLNWFENEISRMRLISWFKREANQFDYYLNAKICDHIPDLNTNQKTSQFIDQQLEQIKRYYDKHITNTSFIMTINRDKNKENSYSMSPIAPILITYMQRFNFDCPDDKLCEMLGNFNADFDLVIKKIKDKNLLREIMLENLKNYKEFANSLIFKQYKYVTDNNIQEANNLIIEIIKDPLFDGYHKTEIITDCVKKNKLVTEIVNHLSNLGQTQILTLCKSLIEAISFEKTKIKKILYDIIANPETNEIKLSAISLLIWLKDEKALQLLIDYCKEHSIIALSDPFNNYHVGADVPDNYLLYENIKMLPLLMEFIELCFSLAISSKYRGYNKIENNIIHLALLSEDNYAEVLLTMEQFIVDKRNLYADVEFLNFTINRIEELYQEKNSRRYAFREAQGICQEIIN